MKGEKMNKNRYIKNIALFIVMSLVILSGCINPEKEKSSSISISPGGNSLKDITLSIKTDNGEFPKLTIFIYDSKGNIIQSHYINERSFFLDKDKLHLGIDNEGSYVIVVKNNLDERIYETNWTISFPHYKVNDSFMLQNGIRVTFLPYQMDKYSQNPGVYKRIKIPIKLESVDALKEERVMIDSLILKVNKGYTYRHKDRVYDLDETLLPELQVTEEISFNIPADTQPVEMTGIVHEKIVGYQSKLETEFVLELSK